MIASSIRKVYPTPARRFWRLGGLAMNPELLTWGLPIALIAICIGGAFAALQVTEVGSEEFWISRGFFVAAAVLTVARIVLWEFTTSRPFVIRLVVGCVVLGVSLGLCIEAVRYVNRKHARWLEAQQSPPTPRLSAAPAVDVPQPKEQVEQDSPNLVDRASRIFCAHQDIWAHVLVEGAAERQYGGFDPNWDVFAIEICNEFRVSPKTAPVSDITAEITYTFPDSTTFKFNRGAWLNGRNRTGFNVNDSRYLIIAVSQIKYPPRQARVFTREYPRAQFIHLDSIMGDLTHGHDYPVEVALVSESRGERYCTLNYMMAVDDDGRVYLVKASEWDEFQDVRAELAKEQADKVTSKAADHESG